MTNHSNINENLLNIIDAEISSLNSTLIIHKNLNKQILILVKMTVGNIPIDFDTYINNPDTCSSINESISHLNKSTKNIKSIEKLLHSLNKIKSSLTSKSKEEIENELTSFHKEFTNIITKIFTNTSDIEKCIHKMSLSNLNNLTISNEKTFAEDTHSSNMDFIENTLVISDKKKKVILPFTLSELKYLLLHNSKKYSSLQDVIDKDYTIPLENYKFAAISRFKEAYKLMTKKEHSSKLKAISLAFELFSNYNLHPAIITACKNLDELDIYLSCLEFNELNDFHFFHIMYEIPLANSNQFNNAI